jgi:hypothetical protein
MIDATFVCTVNVVCHASRCCPLHTPYTMHGICHASILGPRRILCKMLVVCHAYRLGSRRIVCTCRAIFRAGRSVPRTPCNCSAAVCDGRYHSHRNPRIVMAASRACISSKASRPAYSLMAFQCVSKTRFNDNSQN